MMTIKQIYVQALKQAIKADLRGEAAVNQKLKKIKAKYQHLSKEEKAEFDQERLINPYADSRCYAPDLNKPIKKVLAGIDIESGEVLLAKQLGVDLIISHHPLGSALAGLGEVMEMQAEILAKEGIPINIAQQMIHLRIGEVSRQVGAVNHYQAVDTAKLLDLPIMCTHTFADNLVTRYITNLIQRKKPETVGEIVSLLKKIPEYRLAGQRKAGPKIFVGREDDYAGKIVVAEMTGGTNGAKEIYEKMAQAGIGTVVGMHMHEEWKKEAEKNRINVVVAGHMASDSVGMNLMLDKLARQGVQIIPCSGLIRVKR